MYMFIPDVKIKTAQEKTISNVCPISGWIIKSNEIIEIKINDSKYLSKIFGLLPEKIVAKNTIKNGFKTSIGRNLGKKSKSIHRLEPFTSIPIIGTKKRKKRDIKKRIIEYLNN